MDPIVTRAVGVERAGRARSRTDLNSGDIDNKAEELSGSVRHLRSSSRNLYSTCCPVQGSEAQSWASLIVDRASSTYRPGTAGHSRPIIEQRKSGGSGGFGPSRGRDIHGVCIESHRWGAHWAAGAASPKQSNSMPISRTRPSIARPKLSATRICAIASRHGFPPTLTWRPLSPSVQTTLHPRPMLLQHPTWAILKRAEMCTDQADSIPFISATCMPIGTEF